MVKVEFPNLFQVVRPELNALETYLQDDLQQARTGVREVVGHLLAGGGKRIRPALVFLAARFGRSADPDQIMKVAAATEMIHMATLIHDDILDEAILILDRHPLTAGDAIQLATATLTRRLIPGLTDFLCFDQHLRTAASAEGFIPQPI